MAAKFTAFEAINMTNYSNYPRHRLVPNSCIICFSEHIYSWTPLTEKQKKYMLTNYIDSANRIDLKDKDGAKYSMSVAQFRKWIETGSIPKSVLEKKKKESEKVCPLCGGALVLRVAKFGPKPGSQFYGCKNFPECKYTAPYEAEESKEGD